MAVVQAGTWNPPIALLGSFERVMKEVEDLCPESGQQLGDMIVKSHQLITKHREDISLLEVAESLAEMRRRFDLPRSPCNDQLAAYVVLTTPAL